MSRVPSFAEKSARSVQSRLSRADIRFLAALVSASGILVWIAPWQVTLVFLAPACIFAGTTALVSRLGRGALGAYGLFVLMWSVAQFALYLFENPGAYSAALAVSAHLGARLFTLLGLALAVSLAATPLTLGRALSWYLGWLAVIENFICFTILRGRIRPRLAGGLWRAALALCLMMAFFPRAMRVLLLLRRSLALRAPRLAPHRRAALLGLALLRIAGAQTWDMTLAIASRNLYRPEPWIWRKAS